MNLWVISVLLISDSVKTIDRLRVLWNATKSLCKYLPLVKMNFTNGVWFTSWNTQTIRLHTSWKVPSWDTPSWLENIKHLASWQDASQLEGGWITDKMNNTSWCALEITVSYFQWLGSRCAKCMAHLFRVYNVPLSFLHLFNAFSSLCGSSLRNLGKQGYTWIKKS